MNIDEALAAIRKQTKDRKEVMDTLPKREWVGLTDEDKQAAVWTDGGFGAGALWAEQKLKEKNT